MADNPENEVFVTEARESDINGLTTALARSFHPVNPYIKKCMPDTPKVREWWASIWKDNIPDPSTHVLVAIDPSTDKDVGILAMQYMNPDDRGAGFWGKYPYTEDHEAAMCQVMVDSMIESRERLMLGRPHFLIQLFGADDRWKGRGVGKKLLARACEIGDDAGREIFVQANGSAKGIYVDKFGFRVEAEEVMPGEDEYREYMLVRPSKAK